MALYVGCAIALKSLILVVVCHFTEDLHIKNPLNQPNLLQSLYIREQSLKTSLCIFFSLSLQTHFFFLVGFILFVILIQSSDSITKSKISIYLLYQSISLFFYIFLFIYLFYFKTKSQPKGLSS